MNPESFLARLISWVLWPFYYFLDQLERLGRPRERAVDERDVEAEERRLNRRLSSQSTSLFGRLMWWLFLPFYLLLDGLDRLGQWGRSRENAVDEREIDAEEKRLHRRLSRGSLGESFLGRWLGWVLWPFFWMVDWLDRLGQRQERSFDERQIDAEERRIEKKLSRELRTTTQRQALEQTWISRIGSVAQAPVVGSVDFLWQFLSSRRLSLWLWSIPILLSVGLLAVVFYFAQFGEDPRVVARYEAALSQAIKANDSDKIKLYRLKLAQLGSSTLRGEYQTALALADRGELVQAYEIMKKLTPVGQPGFEGAHFWIAQNLIEGRLGVREPESLTLALEHLERLRTRAGDSPEIRLLEGLGYARLGQTGAAVNALSPIANSNVIASFLLMEIYSAEGKQAEARIQAQNVHRKLTQAENQGEKLNEDQRKWLTVATRVIGDAKLAADAVEQWYRANPNSVEARVNRTRILLQQVSTWSRNPKSADLDKMHQNLTQAAATVPIEQAGMLSAIANSIGTLRKQNNVIESLYQKLLSDPNLSGIFVESFGTLAAVDQDWAKADELLGRAAAASPEWGNAWNNWAYVISAAFPNRLDEALRYADKAVTLQPDNPDYRETRGMIYYKLRSYEQAIADLEIAANGINELASVHAALADSHRRLGNNSVADVYERQLLRRRN
ncbi:MAG: hypothetical protein JNL67_18095 [Planctomycetaceae bacterium]|nr:hypothetical protein [Planctomycetaceae bacterium]